MKTSSAHVRRESVPSRELSTFILHRDTGVTDPERPFKSQCSCALVHRVGLASARMLDGFRMPVRRAAGPRRV